MIKRPNTESEVETLGSVEFYNKCLIPTGQAPLSLQCHFKAYWMKVSFALGCQRWRCHGNSFYCYQSSTVWQVNHLFIWAMILSRLDIYSCGMIAEELKIMSVSEMIAWLRFKGTLLSFDFHSQQRHNTLTLLLYSLLIVACWRDICCT